MSERCRNELGETVAFVFKEIAYNPTITIEEISNKIGKTTRTVDRAIDKLKQAKIIVRHGAKLGGYWEVNYSDTNRDVS